MIAARSRVVKLSADNPRPATINISLAYGFTTGAALTNASGSWYGAASLGTLTIGAITSTGINAISVAYTNGSQAVTKTVPPGIVMNNIMRIL